MLLNFQVSRHLTQGLVTVLILLALFRRASPSTTSAKSTSTTLAQNSSGQLTFDALKAFTSERGYNDSDVFIFHAHSYYDLEDPIQREAMEAWWVLSSSFSYARASTLVCKTHPDRTACDGNSMCCRYKQLQHRYKSDGRVDFGRLHHKTVGR